MAELTLTLDLATPVRQAIIQGLVDVVNACPQYRMAVITQLLVEDPITRCILAEELGEQAIKEHAADKEAQAVYDAAKGEGVELPNEKSWDEIMLEVLGRMADTPGGRGEVSELTQPDLVDDVSDELHGCTVFSVEQSGDVLTLRGRHVESGKERVASFKVQP